MCSKPTEKPVSINGKRKLLKGPVSLLGQGSNSDRAPLNLVADTLKIPVLKK
jgi:hypothetical protein